MEVVIPAKSTRGRPRKEDLEMTEERAAFLEAARARYWKKKNTPVDENSPPRQRKTIAEYVAKYRAKDPERWKAYQREYRAKMRAQQAENKQPKEKAMTLTKQLSLLKDQVKILQLAMEQKQ